MWFRPSVREGMELDHGASPPSACVCDGPVHLVPSCLGLCQRVIGHEGIARLSVVNVRHPLPKLCHSVFPGGVRLTVRVLHYVGQCLYLPIF